MSNHNGLRTAFLLLPPLFVLLPLSIIIVVLSRVSNTLFAQNTERDWRYGYTTISLSEPDTSNSTDVTVRIRNEPTLAILGLSLGAIVVSGIGVCGMWELRRMEGSPRQQRAWSWVMLVLNTMTMAASIGVLAYLSSFIGNEKRWQSYADVAVDGQRFTRETWVCQIDQFYSSTQGWAGSACGLEKASRFMLIPLAIASALVILCTCLLVRDRGGARWLFGGKGRYAGFDNIMELHAQRPEAVKGGVASNDRTVYL